MERSEADVMAATKHSFVAFYPSDWLGGTARLPRLHRSVLFDVCCYIWDTAKAVPERELRLMIADVPNGMEIVEDLIATGKLERAADGSITNAKALHEATKAYGAWERMSQGGRNARSNEDTKGDGKGDTTPMPENQNQNQNQITPNGVSHRDQAVSLVQTWNSMAEAAGLSKVEKITDSRLRHLKARIADHGFDKLNEAFKRIPESPFLMGGGDRGWKATIDSMIRPDNAAKLIEGAYHGRIGKASGWLEVIRGN